MRLNFLYLDVEAPPPGVGGHLGVLAKLDPAVAEHRIVLGLDDVHKQESQLPRSVVDSGAKLGPPAVAAERPRWGP